VLRLWLAGGGIRPTERLAGVDHKTVRRYVDAALELGLLRCGGVEKLTVSSSVWGRGGGVPTSHRRRAGKGGRPAHTACAIWSTASASEWLKAP
jgi:hypothetical protein